jgi:galactokinase
MKPEIEQKFIEIFGGEPDFVSVTTPGRANLIGEHIDYQGGYVLPIAVNRFIYSFGRKRTDNKILLFSYNYNGFFETTIENISYQNNKRWANYVLGVIQEFKKLGHSIPGMEIVFGGDVPVGSGLSSSAAVEISMAVLFQKLSGIEIEPVELIKLARRAENEFVGVNCGIMDQFSIYLSKKGRALLLNCNTFDYKYVPLPLKDCSFMLVDTKKGRSLSSSVYNKRVRSVEETLSIIKQYEEINFLTQVKDISVYKDRLSEENYKRARHIVEENTRVLTAVKNLENRKIEGFGRLMYESHNSLKNLYEVSCDELDFIVNFSKEFSGVKGARLTGAGMGGCCIVLIEKATIPKFTEQLSASYKKQFGIKPEFYEVEPVNGAFYEKS